MCKFNKVIIIVIAYGLFCGITENVFSFDYGGGLAADHIVKKARKQADKIGNNSLKPEVREKQRWKAYDEETRSYDARESSRNPNKYWGNKKEKEKKLLDNALIDHRQNDKKIHERYNRALDFLFGNEKYKHLKNP